MQVVALLRRHEFVRRGRAAAFVPAEAVIRHGEAAELGHHVGALGDGGDVLPPALENLVLPSRVGTDAQRCAEVVQHHRGFGHCAGQCQEILVLVEEMPSVVGVAEATQRAHTGTEIRFAIGGWRTAAGIEERTRVVVGAGVADAPEEAIAGGFMRRQHLLERWRAQVRVADDAGQQTIALTRHPRHELRLPHRPHVLRPAFPVARAAIDEHRLLDVVPGVRVRQQVTQGVGAEAQRLLPQVMVGIDDGALWVNDFFLHGLQPSVWA